jgi:hypothetical protein
MKVAPLPDLDPVGQSLRDLDRTLTDLQFIDPIRLYGDSQIIEGALLALTIIKQRIEALQQNSASRPLDRWSPPHAR